jgi:hypothetical protein
MKALSMKERVGLTAGGIWDLLSKKGEISVTQLAKVVKEKPLVIHQALGWLAREDKIFYREEGLKLFVSLTQAERK